MTLLGRPPALLAPLRIDNVHDARLWTVRKSDRDVNEHVVRIVYAGNQLLDSFDYAPCRFFGTRQGEVKPTRAAPVDSVRRSRHRIPSPSVNTPMIHSPPKLSFALEAVVVAPWSASAGVGSLVGQWQGKLLDKFDLAFEIMSRAHPVKSNGTVLVQRVTLDRFTSSTA